MTRHTRSTKMMLVAGARPNFMKIASISDAIDAHNRSGRRPIARVLVHTGQHYDEQMSRAFFKDLSLPAPDIDLQVGSASHARQTADIMTAFEPVLLEECPDIVLVVGDVNSTVACSLVASKILYPRSTDCGRRARPLVAHVEAGLRSFDRSMPEEINRIATDALSDFLFITEQSAAENLIREGVPKQKIHLVGNTMVDTLLKHRHRAQASRILAQLGVQSDGEGAPPAGYAVVTLHRPSNVDDAETFREILDALVVVAQQLPVFFPVHPRTLNRIKEFRIEDRFDFGAERPVGASAGARVRAIPPLGYLDFLRLMSHARLMLTDSGGIQEETTVLGIPCVTLRQNTERPVTLTHGTNVLAGTKRADILHHALAQLSRSPRPKKPKWWDGRAGERIIKVLSAISDGGSGQDGRRG